MQKMGKTQNYMFRECFFDKQIKIQSGPGVLIDLVDIV